MTDQDNTPPAVWDPTARGGAGGWVRRRTAPGGSVPPAPPGPPQGFPPPGFPPPGGGDAEATTVLPPVRDEGPFTGARPYVNTGPPAESGFPPQAPGFPPGFPPGAAPTEAFPRVAGPFDGQPPHQPVHQPPHHPVPAHPSPPGGPGYETGYGTGHGPGGHPHNGPGLAHGEPGAADGPRRRTPLLVAAGVAVVVLLGGGVVWAVQNSDSGGTGTASPKASATAPAQDGASAAAPSAPPSDPPASPSAGASTSPSASAAAGAEAQAKALDRLLARGENAKAPIGSAVAKVTSCPEKAEIESAAQVFDDGAAQRDTLVADLTAMNLSALTDGPEAKQLLTKAWQTSADIDRAYAAWARTVAAQGCSDGTAPSTPDRKRAESLNPQAATAKENFMTKWNAIARTFGLTERTRDRI